MYKSLLEVVGWAIPKIVLWILRSGIETLVLCSVVVTLVLTIRKHWKIRILIIVTVLRRIPAVPSKVVWLRTTVTFVPGVLRIVVAIVPVF